MMDDYVFRPFLTGLCALLFVLSGCAATPNSRFYLLEAMGSSPARGEMTPLDAAISIGLGPVSLPEYLDRPQIVTRSSQSRVQLAEFDRWAEPLSGNVSRTLAENLSFLLQNDSVVPFPWPGSMDVTYQVVVEVYRFDGILGDKAWLDAQWSIQGKKAKSLFALKRSTFVEPVSGLSFEAMVAAQSRALGNLSREIASTLRSLSRDRTQE
jgi:uncharacterized protein